MTPKPTSVPNNDFDPAIESAQRGKFVEAIEQVSQVLAVAESREALITPAALALAEIASAAERNHDHAAAERAMAQAVKLRPRFADLQYRYACVLIVRQQRLSARRALEQALAVNPNYVAARLELAMLDARDGMIGEALSQLRVLGNEAAVDDPRAFSQGLKQLEHARWDEADALLRRALQLSDPELTDRLERFHALMKADEPERAAEVLRESLPRHQGYPDLHYLLGSAELRLGHVDDAMASLACALELNPDFHQARAQFALALGAAGMAAAAADQMGIVLQHEPENREAIAFLRAHESRSTRSGTDG